MATVEMPDNSYAAREKVASERDRDKEKDKKPVEKVIKGSAKRKNKTLGRKIVDFMTGDDIDKVNDYVKYDVIGPGIKNLIFDIIVGAISMSFYGEVRGGSRSRDRDGSARTRRTSYDSMYDNRRDIGRVRGRRPSYDIGDIIFETIEDAEDARKGLYKLLDDYDVARVSDLDRLAGITGPHTDRNYGWTRLDGVGIIPVPEGYILDLPPVEDVR